MKTFPTSRFLVVVSVLVVSCVLAESEWDFDGNFTSEQLVDLKFRNSTIEMVSEPIMQGIATLDGITWVSAADEGSVLNHSAGVTADVIAAFHAPGLSIGPMGFPPTTFGSYISGKSTFDTQFFVQAITTGISGEGTAGLIGFSVPGVIEVDPEGNFVSGISFQKKWSTLTEVSGTPEGVAVYKASLSGETKATVNEYIALSESAGYLKFGKTPVSPNTLEVVIEINDYVYADVKNHLELVFTSISDGNSGKGSTEAQITVNNITKDISTYVSIAAEVNADGKTVAAEATIVNENDLQNGYKISDAVKGLVRNAFSASGSASFNYRKIPFPANAKNIIFDPTIGARRNAHSSASSLVLSLLTIILAVFLLF